MAENTAISWATHTFNPWIGCQKVSPACDGCYAEDLDRRYWGGEHWGPGAPRKRTSPAYWRQPLKWQREAEARGDRPRVFCASLADWADNAVPAEWRLELADVIRATPNLDWLLLTKRIGNVEAMLAAMFPEGVPPNVWLGITVADQREADRDVPKLLKVKTRLGISVAFLSIEPMLGAINLRELDLGGGVFLDALTGFHAAFLIVNDNEPLPAAAMRLPTLPGALEPVDLIFVGGESGRAPRPMPLELPRHLLRQTRFTGCAFHMKQLSQADFPKTYRRFDTFPADLRVRELPRKAA